MIVFTEQEAQEQNCRFHKECFICGKEFFSSARQTKYCSPDCSEKALKKITKRNKTRRTRRKAYDANKEINRALSKAYALAHDVAELYRIPKECACMEMLGVKRDCSGPLQLHHKDLNPFNNSPYNLVWLSASCHKALHDTKENINMVDTFNEALDKAGFEEEDQKYRVMIEYTKQKLEGIV